MFVSEAHGFHRKLDVPDAENSGHLPIYSSGGQHLMSQPTDNRGVSAFDDLEIRLVEILNSLPDGITAQDKNLNIIYPNDAMRAAFGNCCGKKCHEAYEKRDVQCEGCGLSKVFQSEKASLVIRTGVDLQKETAYWENACFPIRDEVKISTHWHRIRNPYLIG